MHLRNLKSAIILIYEIILTQIKCSVLPPVARGSRGSYRSGCQLMILPLSGLAAFLEWSSGVYLPKLCQGA